MSHDYDIVADYETWLNGTALDSSFQIYRYNLLRYARDTRIGGGVIIYYKSARIFNYASEFLNAEFKVKNSKLLFAVIYRPFRTRNPLEFFKEIESLLSSYRHFVLTGDLNADK